MYQLTEMSELPNKDFEVVNTIQDIRLNTFETNEKIEGLRKNNRKYKKGQNGKFTN